MNKPINDLFQKEMSRKEFLATVGLGTAAVFGLSTALRFIGVGTPFRQVSTGYGSSTYGGEKREK